MYIDNVINTNVPKFWLEQEYVIKQRSMQEIAFDLDISAQTLYRILCVYGIQVRTNQYARKHLSIDKDWLIEEYVNKRRSTTDISKELGCGYNTINRRLREYGIVVRDNGKPQKTELLGQTFGNWRVISEVSGKTENHSRQWRCKCTCGEIKVLSTYTLTSGASKGCPMCDVTQTQAEKHLITSYYWGSLQSSARKRGLNFAISKDYASDLYEQQGRRCTLTGMRLNMADTHSAWHEGKQTASLDRIDSLLGYENGNVQWVHKMVNLAKWDLPQEEFIRVCNLVARLHPVEIMEEEVNPEINIDDQETSEWDSDLWRMAGATIPQSQ